MLRILHTESACYSQSILDKLSRDYQLFCKEIESQSELLEHLRSEQYFAIFTKLGLMLDAEVLKSQVALKYIISPTTGLNHIDLEYCRINHIEVISLKGESEFLSQVKSTAEHTWMLIMAMIRNFPASYESVLKGNWDRRPFQADELDGATIGIVGFGRLGRIVARYAHAFGMNVLVTDRIQFSKLELGIAKQAPLEELLANSDIVSLLISYDTDNLKFLGAKEFEMMKRGSYFVNTSRGEMIDESALVDCLGTGKIKAAALDVLNNDSAWSNYISKDNAIFKYAQNNSNVILTPHMGGFGFASIQKTRAFVAEKFIMMND